MIKVCIIGSGNVAHHLTLAFQAADQIEIAAVYSRSGEKIQGVDSMVITDLEDLPMADVYIISVSDSAIADIASKLPFSDRLVVHTSGSVGIDAITEQNRAGVFYPLQTFSKNKTVDLSDVPICIEALSEHDYKLLETVGRAISGVVQRIDSKKRRALHLAAVFVSNFTNRMYGIGEQICQQHNISFDLLKPLIQQTADKILALSPTQAQTGPAKRRDQATIDAHLALLNDEQKKIYQIMTQSIQNG